MMGSRFRRRTHCCRAALPTEEAAGKQFPPFLILWLMPRNRNLSADACCESVFAPGAGYSLGIVEC